MAPAIVSIRQAVNETLKQKDLKMTTLWLNYLNDDDGAEIITRKDVDDEQLETLAALGRRIIDANGEFSADEIEDLDNVQLARLGASSEMGGDAYEMACSFYLD
jgi:hypothetical protein